jgi:hypothetical protein
MKKWSIFLFFFLPAFAFANPLVEYYIGEMKAQMCEEETSEHYGFLFLKRTFFPYENRFVDHCLISSRDGETLELEQTSDLKGDLHEIILSDEQGLISGKGELIGFPWEWTHLQEKLQLNIESPVEVEVNNTIEKDTMFSMASVFTLESDGTRVYFGTFSAKLYRVDIEMIEKFFHESFE